MSRSEARNENPQEVIKTMKLNNRPKYRVKRKSCIDCEPRDGCAFILTDYGYCCYVNQPSESAFIFNLYVYKEFRRTGHAKEILRTCIAKIRGAGYEKEILIEANPREDSIPTNSLEEFYIKMGLIINKGDKE